MDKMATTRRGDFKSDTMSSISSLSIEETYLSADDNNLREIRPYSFEPPYAANEIRNKGDSDMEDEEIMNQRLQDLNW